ncbi:WecB/TagA/CpsF family glycosyltransferase [Paraburkholderia panacisoli]|uniref:WecB/TagA/CpsF family glycosyltransferase n=1 Tax=Paraburkholderia panacisoli TaxID=2603818 RepID=UPI0024827C51|nr:WecB/TagA/CpsF family glycosyltransferase [Paraburkholderia panacisoli]
MTSPQWSTGFVLREARLLFVAITSPKKENFINRWKGQLGVDFVMGVGGTFDVVAGKVRRAPRWMQRSGLEWAYRVAQEPRRMWRRYFVTNNRFALMLLKACIGSMFQRTAGGQGQ